MNFRYKIFTSLTLIFFVFFFSSCGPDPESEIDFHDTISEEQKKSSEGEITAHQFFWGTWVRMDNGKSYEILETKIYGNGLSYTITASDSTNLTAANLGTFVKESDCVIVCENIPYFRDGGVNLEYSLKLVGMASTIERAASSSLAGIKGFGRSKKYSGFISEAQSDSEGKLTFTAPTADDIQTVTINNDDSNIIVSDLHVSNSGDYMGTIALVGQNDYNLKITGEISADQKQDGYLFGNNAKSYNLELTIKNISENKCSASVCTIEAADPNLLISSTDGTELSGFGISTLEKGSVKTLYLEIAFGNLLEPFIDTGIKVTIVNPFTNQKWTDYVPLRFYKGNIPITIAAKNPENNKDAALNGFIIYPDGNNQFFAIPHNKSKTLFVPTFGSDKQYKLVFSGATVTSQLSASTEMFYTVEIEETMPRPVITDAKNIELETLLEYMIFGGNNHSESTAYDVTESFESFLQDGEIDYYTITADCDSYYNLAERAIYSVEYESERGNCPTAFFVEENTLLSAQQLPDLSVIDNHLFLGWYDGETKVEADNYRVNKNVKLVAKWADEIVYVSFIKSSGELAESLCLPKGAVLEVLQLSKTDDTRPNGKSFAGWYVKNASKKEEIVLPGYVVNEDIELNAKWVENIENYTLISATTINAYYICKNEVTQAEYYSITETNPSAFNSDPDEEETQENRPVESVSWYDAIYFCNKYSLSQGFTPCYKVNGSTDIAEWNYLPHASNSIEGTIECDFDANGYRLATEEEWYHVDLSPYLILKIPEDKSPQISGWFLENSNNKTHEVKTKTSNMLGVFDMVGNVSEWCWNKNDGLTNTEDAGKRALRGGAWNNTKVDCASSKQYYADPSTVSNTIGFRLVRSFVID